MAKNEKVFFTKDPAIAGIQVTGTNYVDVFTAGNNGCIVTALWAAETGGSAYVVTMRVIYSASGAAFLWSVTVPANSGNNGTDPAIALMNDTDSPFVEQDHNGNYRIKLPPGAVLQVKADSDPSNDIEITALYEDF